MKCKLIFFWLVLAAFVGLTVWWVLYVPYDRARLYRAIPGNALFVSEHARVAERWPEIARNPFTLCLLATAGFRPDGLTNAVMDKGLLEMLERFAGRNTVLAYVPSLNGSGEPAWVLSSWVGMQGQMLKWYTDGMLAAANLRKARLDSGRQIWQLRTKQSKDEPDLSFALVEGVLLACLSRDSVAVRHLISRIEYGAPLQADLRAHLEGGTAAGGQSLDHGIVRWHRKEKDAVRLRVFRFELSNFTGTTLSGRLVGDQDLLVPSESAGSTNLPVQGASYRLKDSPGLDSLPDVLGRQPQIFAVLPYNFVAPILSGRRVSRGVRIISNAINLHADTNTAMYVSVFGGDLSGRVLGLKVPSLIAGVHVKDETNSIAQVAETMDILNALYKLAIIPRRDEAGGRPLVVMDSTRQGIYGSIAATDKPAVTTKDGWLAVSSSLGTLTNVVCQPQRQTAGDGALPRWAAGAKCRPDCAAYLWIDFDSAIEAVRNAMAVYSLVLMAQNTESTVQTRALISKIQTWLKVLKPVKTAEVRLSLSGCEFELSFDMGPDL